MPAQMIVELPSGNKILFGGRGAPAGLSEVSLREGIARATGEQFRKALGTLGELVATLEHAVESLPRRPETVEIELKASLSGECDLWIVSGEGEAEFKVKLAWGKGE